MSYVHMTAPDMRTDPTFTAERKSRVPCKKSSVAILPGTKFTSNQSTLHPAKNAKQEPVTNSDTA